MLADKQRRRVAAERDRDRRCDDHDRRHVPKPARDPDEAPFAEPSIRYVINPPDEGNRIPSLAHT
jgi:hypothetical protein